MKIEITINDKLWIEIELEDSLGKSLIDQIDQAFAKIATDENKDELEGFIINPRALPN